MIDLNNGTSLTSDRVNEATEALAFGKDRLEAIGQLLCCTDCLHLEKSGLEGFRNMIAATEVDIENALEALEGDDDDGDEECYCHDEEAPKDWEQYDELNKLYRKTYAENLKLKRELADMKAISEIQHVADNAYGKVLRENKEKTVGEMMPKAEGAFNSVMTEGFKAAGIKTEEDMLEEQQQRAIDRAMAAAEAISAAEYAAKTAPRYELAGNDR